MNEIVFKRYLKILIVAFIAFLLPVIFNFEFLDIDDTIHLHDNLNLNSLSGLATLWSSPYFDLYIPVTYTFWALVKYIFGLHAGVFHLFNLFFHILNSYLVFILIKNQLRVRNVEIVAVFSSLLFLVHPFSGSAIGWISEFRGVLGFTFFLLDLLALPKFLSSKRSKSVFWGLIVVIVAAFAMLAKPVFIVTPLCIIALSRSDSLRTFKLWYVITIQLVLSFGTYLITSTAQVVSLPKVALESQLVLVFSNLGFYFSKLFLPFDLALDFGLTVEQMSQLRLETILGALVLVALLLTLFFTKTNLRFYFLTSFLMLMPTLGVLPFAYQYYNTVALS